MKNADMKNMAVGMRALAVEMPPTVRTNDYWHQKHPELVADAQRKTLARLWSAPPDSKDTLAVYDAEMAPYLSDPFRGTVERRVLTPGQPVLALEARAARKALAAASMSASDVDLLMVCSFLPDQPGVGNATPLARELGLRCATFNIESTCSSGIVAFQTAAALIRAGEYRHVLVVISCTYSRVSDERDTLGWFMGDGAAAFLVGPTHDDGAYLGAYVRNTAETCGTFYYHLVHDEAGQRIQINCTPSTGSVLRSTGAAFLKDCCEGAARAADTRLEDIDFFVFNTPTAWYSAFCARALGVPPDRTVNTYPLYANIGPALMPVNLHHAASLGNIRRGDTVMLYTIGSVSSAGALVMRWGDVGLGALPGRD